MILILSLSLSLEKRALKILKKRPLICDASPRRTLFGFINEGEKKLGSKTLKKTTFLVLSLLVFFFVL
jgi:hypothetical protein